MIALQDTLVEWAVLAVALAVAAALLLRVRQQRRLSRRPRVWLPCVALAAIVASAGVTADAAAAGGLQATVAAASEPGGGGAAAAVRLGAIAAVVSLVVLLMAWLYLSRSLRVLPPAVQEEGGSPCCADCPECGRENQAPPTQNPGRKRARGLTMTRLGGE